MNETDQCHWQQALQRRLVKVKTVKSLEMDSFSAVRFPFRGFFFSSCFSPSKSVHSSCPHVGSTCVKEPSKFRSSDPQFSSFARSDGGTSKPVVHRVGQTFQEKRTRKRTGSSSLCPRPTPQEIPVGWLTCWFLVRSQGTPRRSQQF